MEDEKIVLESQPWPCSEDLENYMSCLDFIVWKTQKGKMVRAAKSATSVEEGDKRSPEAEKS